MLPRIEYSVTVPVSVDAAFQAFQDLERLLHRGIYDEALWVEGKPWEVGSRLRYVLAEARADHYFRRGELHQSAPRD